MKYTIKHSFEYKLIGIILYFCFSLSGISIILLYSPKNLLFNEKTEEEKIKLNLYKDFSKNIYENINTPLIKNLTLTEDGKDCPHNFELLKIKNQYNGHFRKFYGNKSICIERLNDDSYSYKNILKKMSFIDEKKNKKKCGELIKNSRQHLYVSNEMNCPLNHIEINTESRAKTLGNNYYKMGPGDQYITPIFGNDSLYPIIINIEIINNNKVCLEKYNNLKDLPCEFPDNNECLIEDNFVQIYSIEQNDKSKLYPENLAKWNLVKDFNVNHNFCKNDLKFHIFVHGYINFTDISLQEFEAEFPSIDITNNSLYKSYKTYKSPRNIDNFFYLISYNLFIWSFIHFLFQIMLYSDKKGIRTIYVNNGIILFFFKLSALIGMIINYYCFYLKIEKVYLVMIDKPRNKVLEYYSQSRNVFIIKMIINSLIGFTIICVDLIILFFSLTVQWGIDFKQKEKEITKNTEENLNVQNIDNRIILDEIPLSFGEPHFSIDPNLKEMKDQNEWNLKNNNIEKDEIHKKISDDKLNGIKLQFFYKNNSSKAYTINIGINDKFKEAEKILKENYSELKGKDMRVFTHDSNIINKEKTISDNGLSDNMQILII